MEEQETLLEILKKRLVERRRDEIAQNARTTLKTVRAKKAKYGKIKDLENDPDTKSEMIVLIDIGTHDEVY